MNWTIAIAGYCGLGALIMSIIPSSRSEIMATIHDKDLAGAPPWKVILFWVMMSAAALFLWPLLTLDFLKRKKSVLETLEENPEIRKLKGLRDLMDSMCDGCDGDEIPNGYGHFGYDITNPIPTHTIFGSTYYLSHLWTDDGHRVVYTRNGSRHAGISAHPIDEYTISHPDGRRIGVLYLSPYHKRTSEKAPSGFRLFPPVLGQRS